MSDRDDRMYREFDHAYDSEVYRHIGLLVRGVEKEWVEEQLALGPVFVQPVGSGGVSDMHWYERIRMVLDWNWKRMRKSGWGK